MRKLIIIGVLAALLLAGCTAPEAYTASVSDVTEETIMSKTTTTAKPTTTAATAETTIATTVTPKVAAQAAAAGTADTPESKTLSLDVLASNEDMSVKFTAVTVNYEYQSLELKYELVSSPTVMPDKIEETFCVTKSGTKLKCGGIGGTEQRQLNGAYIGGDNSMSFYKYNSLEDISNIIVTFKYENVNPVTVEIDIPGL